MRGAVGLVAALAFAAACSSGSSSFAVSGAHVDPTYVCPASANNAAYDLHATVNVHNGTSSRVTISSASADLTLVTVSGAWLQKVGDRYHAAGATVVPSEVAAGADAELELTIPSACTSGKHGSGASSSGQYRVSIHLVTSAGTYSVTAANEHEIVAA